MEQRPNQSAGPRDFSGPMRGCRLCTRQCRLRSGPVGFENKCGRVGLGSNFFGSVSGRVYLFKKMIYARRVRVRSDSGRVRILGPKKTSNRGLILNIYSKAQVECQITPQTHASNALGYTMLFGNMLYSSQCCMYDVIIQSNNTPLLS